ncbi:GTPase-associated system all-helical protein GASH [Microtetraspora sp. NBRC 16547]|uniref:GTPase-associated system all-helical protein GASH n=1 Tax=Microtetraspora sp. NBRC 16547 TaxID=3030993 RepID=UPI0024A39651|nr:GTPase-associated system all-helical protein GASH [Microtetraspora sp. NBRC 16547]GLW98197.1 hypothetical protein Misp02_22840 [Microtetraspora sp. NBRC 16547]
MSEDVILRFLTHGLVDVGGDDTRLAKIQQTTGSLVGVLKKAPSKAVPFSLVAFDPRVPKDDPIVIEALEALKKQWTTYANVFASTPMAVVRAMLLDALVKAAAADERIGVAFVALARNALPHLETGDEQAIWSDIVNDVEAVVNRRAEEEWAAPASITVPSISFDLVNSDPMIQLTVKQTDRVELTNQYRAAAGATFHQPRTGSDVSTNGNPHHASSNPAQWVTEFGERMANATADVIENAVENAEVEQESLTEALKTLMASVSGHVEQALKSVSGATAGLERRTNLLWWKEALFSPSTRLSYREMSPEVAVTLMAFDLHRQVPTFTPASVTAFLYETVLRLPAVDVRKTSTIRDLVLIAQDDATLVALRDAVAEWIAAPAGRVPLLSLLAHPEVAVSLDVNEFHRLTGLAPDTEFSLPEWAAWIFRELQAVRAVADQTTSKRRGRTG